jgi:hypothetical protein
VHAVCVTSLGVKENKLIYRQSPGYMSPHLCKFELICTFLVTQCISLFKVHKQYIVLGSKFPLLGIFVKNEYTPKLTDCVRQTKV